MGGEFRAGLLNHATFDEIQDDSRKFVECTWVKGYTPDSIRVLITGWYEVRNAELCPVDSLEWTEDTDFLKLQKYEKNPNKKTSFISPDCDDT